MDAISQYMFLDLAGRALVLVLYGIAFTTMYIILKMKGY